MKLFAGIGVAVLTVIVIVGIILVVLKRPVSDSESQQSTLPQNEMLKSVEDSVEVDVALGNDGKRVNFEVQNIPDKYETIEYEFTYLTGSGRLQGGNSSPSEIEDNQYSKEILLGTCSAGGACTYDTGVTSIKFSIIFTAGEERRSFEKEFSL